MMLAIVSSLAVGCSRPVPQNAFRVTSKRDIRVFGIPVGLKVKNPFVFLNLRTTNTSGATGAVNEFNPGGQYINTGANASFDAVNAILPAPWTIRAAPSQILCANNSPITVSAVNGGKYDFDCITNVSNSLTAQPGFVDLSDPIVTPDSLTGTGQKGILLQRANQNLKVYYYKQVSGDDYEAVGEKPVVSVSPDGQSVQIPLPDYDSTARGYRQYRALIAEDGNTDVYLAHISFGLFHGFYEPPPCTEANPCNY